MRPQIKRLDAVREAVPRGLRGMAMARVLLLRDDAAGADR